MAVPAERAAVADCRRRRRAGVVRLLPCAAVPDAVPRAAGARCHDPGCGDAERVPSPGRVSRHGWRSEEHTSELQSRLHLVCRLLLEKKKKIKTYMQKRNSGDAGADVR